ncbi:MAG: hypothetical protein IIC50_04185, partial [Planctomycetes bacterium]|nr:hypothetical protein [Planctomycetota bacterium]
MSKKSIRLMAVVCLLGWATLDADFVEDFESYEVHAFLDSLPNWTTVVFGNANTEVTGGDYFIESVNGSNRLHSPRGGATIAVVNADVLTLVAGADFELSVDMMWIGNGIGNGLIFNYQDQGNFYYLEIISPQRGDTGFNLKKRAGGSSQTLVGIAPADLALNTEYRLHVQYKAGPNTFEVSLETLDDGIVVQAFGDIVDDSFRGGQIGVWSNSSFTGQFDNLTLVKASGIAEAPNPAIDAPDVARDAVLTWKPGQFASTHDVYFGTQFDDVNDASRANPLDVLVSQGQSDTSFDPAGVLEFGQTYFWRVDEVNSAPDFAVFKGGIWSFTAE